jgi:hypothetical protein
VLAAPLTGVGRCGAVGRVAAALLLELRLEAGVLLGQRLALAPDLLYPLALGPLARRAFR